MSFRPEGSRAPAPARSAAAPVGIDIALGTMVVLAVALVAALIPRTQEAARMVVIAAGVLVAAAVTVDAIAAGVTVLLAWLLATGFLVNRMGEISVHGLGDLYRFAVLGVAGSLGLAMGAAWRFARGGARRQARPRLLDDTSDWKEGPGG